MGKSRETLNESGKMIVRWALVAYAWTADLLSGIVVTASISIVQGTYPLLSEEPLNLFPGVISAYRIRV